MTREVKYDANRQQHWRGSWRLATKETRAWLATQPAGRFAFTFTPKHGSRLNLIFSKFARSVLRHLRVASKQELKGCLAKPRYGSFTSNEN
jgi:hypothetical protein